MFVSPADKAARKFFPRLKSKAYETKVTLPAVMQLWRRTMNGNNTQHQWVLLGLELSDRMEHILAEHSQAPALPVEAHSELLLCMKNHAAITVALQDFFGRQGQKLFQAGTFKQHWLLHAAQEACHVNPLHVHCYSGESFMSNCKQLLQRCLYGRNSASSIRAFIRRYTQALSLECSALNSQWRLR